GQPAHPVLLGTDNRPRIVQLRRGSPWATSPTALPRHQPGRIPSPADERILFDDRTGYGEGSARRLGCYWRTGAATKRAGGDRDAGVVRVGLHKRPVRRLVGGLA